MLRASVLLLFVVFSGSLTCCAGTFPEELQGRWEYEDDFHFEWFVVYEDELYFHRVRKPGSTLIEDTMSLREMDEENERFRTSRYYFLYRWEGDELSFAYAEDDYPTDPEWRDVHHY